MTDLNLHLLLFMAAGAALVLTPLLLGTLVRPRIHTEEKDAVYECGEPTIGSSYVQFDIRFYVVALLFIIFDVEVAFFFPWALIFGGSSQLADPSLSEASRVNLTDKLLDLPPGTSTAESAISAVDASRMAWLGFADILVFFGVLLVGFAYVWKRGDLDWVRAMVAQAKEAAARPKAVPVVEQKPKAHSVA
ncbi:MAG: NADH-quinone oxidoreductase subunit A [Planctomycetaceae bacterium]|nr:NADH-quinone oxidoreductase subunit A [Planctomycetaceae bacterium]